MPSSDHPDIAQCLVSPLNYTSLDDGDVNYDGMNYSGVNDDSMMHDGSFNVVLLSHICSPLFLPSSHLLSYLLPYPAAATACVHPLEITRGIVLPGVIFILSLLQSQIYSSAAYMYIVDAADRRKQAAGVQRSKLHLAWAARRSVAWRKLGMLSSDYSNVKT